MYSRKQGVAGLLLLVIVFCSGKSFAQCDPTLWGHVYNSYRLTVNNPCITVTGHVYSLIYEDDGDIHIRLTLDTPYRYMLNSVNYSGQYGRLVCEPLCATTCIQTNAMASCAGFTNTVYIPNVGEYVQVTGSFVTDKSHGWNEIHPVTSITFPNAVQSINAIQPLNIVVFPNPAKDKVTFRLDEKPRQPLHITILDAVGRLAGQYQLFDTKELTIKTSFLPSGKYFYHLEQEEKYIKGGEFSIVE